jgi:hypothetical protein
VGSLFTVNGRFSVARLQIVWGMYYLVWAYLTVGKAPNASVWAFLIATIILTAGAAGLLLEARLARMPAHLRAWLAYPERKGPQYDSSSDGSTDGSATASASHGREPDAWPPPVSHPVRARGLPDLAVLQLAVGIVAVPVAILLRNQAPDWRAFAIAAISEIIYFAYLGAQIIQVAELSELAKESRRLELRQRLIRTQPRRRSPSSEGGQASEQLKDLELAQQALRARGREMWQDLYWMFDPSPPLPRRRPEDAGALRLPPG